MACISNASAWCGEGASGFSKPSNSISSFHYRRRYVAALWQRSRPVPPIYLRMKCVALPMTRSLSPVQRLEAARSGGSVVTRRRTTCRPVNCTPAFFLMRKSEKSAPAWLAVRSLHGVVLSFQWCLEMLPTVVLITKQPRHGWSKRRQAVRPEMDAREGDISSFSHRSWRPVMAGGCLKRPSRSGAIYLFYSERRLT